MANVYRLPEAELKEIRKRDVCFVDCHKEMLKPVKGTSSKNWATIEHLNHLPPWNNPKTVVIFCESCNSSRGNRTILEWFDSE